VKLPVEYLKAFGRSARDALPHHPTLSSTTYLALLRHLMFLEESQEMFNLQRYDTAAIISAAADGCFRIDVRGLAEGRPSLIAGDFVKVKRRPDDDGKIYEGAIAAVEQESILVRFDASFKKAHPPPQRFGWIRFVSNRSQVLVRHRAINVVASSPSLLEGLFPSLPWPQTPLAPSQRRSDVLNDEQHLAATIASDPSLPPHRPFLIFGPPGTGKTVTLVEAIVRIAAAAPGPHILVVAPSNSAVDNITQRLLEYLPASQILRAVAYSRSAAAMPAEVLNASNFSLATDRFEAPPLEDVDGKLVLAATLSYAGTLFGLKLTRGFTHIFIDEACQCTEPDAAVVLAFARAADVRVVMAGDPLQLGPTAMCDVAASQGLTRSAMERLMEGEVYKPFTHAAGQEGCVTSRGVVKLVRNYRSHNELLSLPSAMFYDGELRACADQNDVGRFVGAELLQGANRMVPMLFVNVNGREEREPHSPSRFNGAEVEVALRYAIEGTRAVGAAQVGVITPYRLQADKLKAALTDRGVSTGGDGLRVGTVEEFQGMERHVIVISTVRATEGGVDGEFEARRDIGFVADAKRFNVAVTRARSLLVVVGNAFVLAHQE
jgi:helicase MOV-10